MAWRGKSTDCSQKKRGWGLGLGKRSFKKSSSERKKGFHRQIPVAQGSQESKKVNGHKSSKGLNERSLDPQGKKTARDQGGR